MNYEVSYHDYRELCALASQKDENISDLYPKCIDSLFTNWTSRLGHDKLCVIGFILSRTLKYGKAVAAIPFPAFLGGVCSEEQGRAITSGLKMSHNTLRRVLKELVEDGFLHVFSPEKRRGIMDTFTRYFEIDFKKLLQLTSKGSRIMAILREPKAKKVASEQGENPLRTPRKARVSGLPNLVDLSISIAKEPKGSYTAGAARSGKDGIESTPTTSTVKRVIRAVRPTVTQTVDSLRAKVEAMQQQMRERRAAKASTAAKKAPRGLSQQDVQALFDRATAQYAPDGPRMVVTGKAFGAMRNHLKRNAPADFADFVNWTVRSWGTMSYRHGKHVAKHAKGTGEVKEAIPAAPNFNAFGYRLPYFLAAYNNAKLDTSMFGDQEERQKAAIAKAQRATQAAQQEAASLRALLEKRSKTARQQPQEQRPAPAARTTRRPVDDDLDIPTWEEQQNKGA